MAEAAALQTLAGWLGDDPITDEQIETLRRVLDSALSQGGGGFAPFVVRKLLAEVDRCRRGAPGDGRPFQQYRITGTGAEHDEWNSSVVTHATCSRVLIDDQTDVAEVLQAIADHRCPGPAGGEHG